MRKIIFIFTTVSLLGWAVFFSDIQENYGLPSPSSLLYRSRNVDLPVLRGLKLNPADPFKIEFIIDMGDKNNMSTEETDVLVKYFMAGLTVPDEDMWVNLSPYEQDRIVPEKLGITDMGKDLLGQDYVLKQLSSSLTHPDTSSGRAYWGMENRELKIENGSAQISTERAALSRIWIVPETAELYEKDDRVLITDATLDVRTEEDRFFRHDLPLIRSRQDYVDSGSGKNPDNPVDPVKNCLLPAIKQDINAGKNFAKLRQIYHALILARWFKKKMRETVYAGYINNNVVSGIEIKDKNTKENIWKLYCTSYEKGVYDELRLPGSEVKGVRGKSQKRRYFSGGAELMYIPTAESAITDIPDVFNGPALSILIENHPVMVSSSVSAGSLSHEIKNGLAVVTGSVSVLTARKFKDVISNHDRELLDGLNSEIQEMQKRLIPLHKAVDSEASWRILLDLIKKCEAVVARITMLLKARIKGDESDKDRILNNFTKPLESTQKDLEEKRTSIEDIIKGELRKEKQYFSLNNVLGDKIAQYRERYPDILWDLMVSRDSQVLAFETDFDTILNNLLDNSVSAIKSASGRQMKSRGHCVIELNYDDDMAVIVLKDNGVGMREETVLRMFEADFSLNESGVGTGLGSTLAKKTVEAMGGNIFVRSSYIGDSDYPALGHGSLFMIRLPAVEAIPLRPPPVLVRKIYSIKEEVTVIASSALDKELGGIDLRDKNEEKYDASADIARYMSMTFSVVSERRMGRRELVDF